MMPRRVRKILGDEHGFSLVELLVAISIFVLLVLAIDVVFATVNISSRTAELAADVAQNGRVAIERLTREIRFSGSSSSEIRPSTLFTGSASDWVAFRSARHVDNPTVFCLDVAPDDDDLYYAPCGAPRAGSYEPWWQAWIVYALDGDKLCRDVTTVEPTTPPQCATGSPATGNIIAASVSSFSVTLSGNVLDVTLDLQTTEADRVQGAPVPTQRITLTGRTFIRN